MPLQSCSNTPIGVKLENSFDVIDNPAITGNTINIKPQKKPSEMKNIKSLNNNNMEQNGNDFANINKENLISTKDILGKKSTQSIKKVFFNPQPYRIILKLSGANPSAPAEKVTEALRKAGVQFEVEKIERFEDGNLLKDTSFKRKEFRI